MNQGCRQSHWRQVLAALLALSVLARPLAVATGIRLPRVHAHHTPPAFVNPRLAARPSFVATPRSPRHDETKLPPVHYEGSRRLTRFLDLTMNNSPYPGDKWQTPNESTRPLQAWYANVTKGVTAKRFAEIAAGLHCDAWEYDVMNDGSGSDGGNGHTAFFSPTGPIFPQLVEKNCDFFGELSSELKARGLEVFVYMPIAYNHYFASAHPEAGWLYRNKTSGRIPRPLNISCLNYPGYIQLVANYTRQVIRQYAPAAVRYDGWQMTIDHHCDGCKQFYRQLYGEELPPMWRPEDWRRQYEFQRATTTRAVRILREAAVALDPEILTWANGIVDNTDWELNSFDAMEASLNVGFSEGFGATWQQGIFEQMLMLGLAQKPKVPKAFGRKYGCVAGQWMGDKFKNFEHIFAILFGIMYEYSHLDYATAMPVLSDAYKADVKRVYGAVEDLDPLLQSSELPKTAAIVYSEATRLRYFHFAREGYLNGLEQLWVELFNKGITSEVIPASVLESATNSGYKVIVVMESSGLTPSQLAGLRAFARSGGRVVISGDALLFDETGQRNSSAAHSMISSVGFAYTDNHTCACKRQDAGFGIEVDLLLHGKLSKFHALPSCFHGVQADNSLRAQVVGTANFIALAPQSPPPPAPGDYVAFKQTKASAPAFGIQHEVNTSTEAETLCNADAACKGFDYFWCDGKSDKKMCADLKKNVTAREPQSTCTLYVKKHHPMPTPPPPPPPQLWKQHVPLVLRNAVRGGGAFTTVLWRNDADCNLASDPCPACPKGQFRGSPDGSGCCGGQSNSTDVIVAAVLKELEPFVPALVVGATTKEPKVIVTMQRLNISDTRWVDWQREERAMRYNVYFLTNDTTTVDLCLGNARVVSSQYPRTGWTVEAARVGARDSRCAGGSGALRIKVADTGGLNVRVVSVL